MAGCERRIVEHAHGPERPNNLMRDGEPAPDARRRRQSTDILAVQQDVSRIRPQHAGNDFQQGRLAGAVGSNQTDELAFGDRKRDVVEDTQSAKSDRDRSRFEDRCHELRSLRVSDATIPARPPGAKRMISTRRPP